MLVLILLIFYIIVFLVLSSLTNFQLLLDSKFNYSCGNIFNKSINHDTSLFGRCGDPSYELVCENHKTVLYLYYGRHRVQAMVAGKSIVRSVTAGIDSNECPAINLRSITYNNFTDDFSQLFRDTEDYLKDAIVLIGCKNPIDPSPEYVDIATPCASRTTGNRYYSYVVGGDSSIRQLPELCSIDMILRVWPSERMKCNKNFSCQIRTEQMKGIELRWQPNRCREWQRHGDARHCRFDNSTDLVLCRVNNIWEYATTR